eukprot:6173926-Pleurochrysis_carterae.AAC.3
MHSLRPNSSRCARKCSAMAKIRRWEQPLGRLSARASSPAGAGLHPRGGLLTLYREGRKASGRMKKGGVGQIGKKRRRAGWRKAASGRMEKSGVGRDGESGVGNKKRTERKHGGNKTR